MSSSAESDTSCEVPPSSSSETDLHCARCGVYACWTGSRSLSQQQVQDWWDGRIKIAQENGYADGAVICITCQAYFASKRDTSERTPKEETSNDDNLKDKKESEKIHKKLILIRHAESENNVDKREAKLAFNKIKKAQSLPSFSQLCSAGRLLTIPMNSDLSIDGERMLLQLRDKLQAMDFLASQKVELILHSPLLRARKTCYSLFSPSDDNNNHTIPILENASLFEKNISETLSLTDMNIRIRAFTDYVLSREERCIVIVGHSAFFRAFLNTPVRLNNCEVAMIRFTDKGTCYGALEILVEGGEALLA